MPTVRDRTRASPPTRDLEMTLGLKPIRIANASHDDGSEQVRMSIRGAEQPHFIARMTIS
jgi:hypothetical protein